MTQIVLTHFTEDERKWFIHNDQNGHEYIFTISKDGDVEITSTSANAATHFRYMAINFLDALMSSFAKSFSELENMTVLKKALQEGRDTLEKKG